MHERETGLIVSALRDLNDSVAPLIVRAQHGDAAAFADIVRACRPLVYRWSVVATGDPDEAEDVTQEVLVRLHLSLGRYRTDATFTTWLYRMTRNAATDRFRRYQSRLRLLRSNEALPGAPDPKPGASASDGVLAAEASGIVRRFLAWLPRRQREVLDLVDLQDFTPAEAAELLGLDGGTVRAHLHRARRTLRSKITERYPEYGRGEGE
ncbi:MAG: RNA polymerase sigma factor [Gemmatimonadales bacterium]|nr:MAG: RNA polymerase sigma factor [Gemmatimonadales bacterium]